MHPRDAADPNPDAAAAPDNTTAPDNTAAPVDTTAAEDEGRDGGHGPGRPSGKPTPTTTVDRAGRAFTRQGRRPHLSVTIPLSTLGGLDRLPGTLAGFGAIPACLARAIATSAGTVTALITDPTTGMITDAGALTYRPSQQLRDKVAALVATCQFPSCRQPVWRCDIDHRDAFNHHDPEHGGRTDDENAGPFCRRHHLVKHHTDWRIRVSPERFTLDWTSPTGHQYRTKARPATLPDLHVTTVGTAVAERLDLATSEAGTPATPYSSTDDLVATLLLRHHLNQPPTEYDHPTTAWDQTAPDHPNGETPHRAEDPGIDPQDPPPPF